MKVLMIVPSLKKTGPINVALSICIGLKKFGVVIDVLSLASGELHTDFEENCRELFIKDKFDILSIKKIIQGDYDIVHSHCLVPDLLSCFFSEKSLSTVHNYINPDYVESKGFIIGGVMSFVHKIALNNIDNVISCSKSVRNYLQTKYSINSSFVRNGVAPSQKRECNYFKRFIMVNALIKRKNVEVAIEGFIKANLEGAQLLVLGDGVLRESLMVKFEDHKNIHFVGNVENPRDYLRESDIFLSSSKAEGLPLSLLEALSEGLGYIVSDIGPHREIFELARKSGIIVSNEVEEFSNAIVELNTPEIMMGSSYSYFVREFSLDVMSSNYFKFYKNFVSNS